MTLLVLSILVASIGAVLTCWRPPRMPRYSLLLAFAVAPQVASMLGWRMVWLFAISALLIGIWCFYNRDVAGVLCITIGAAMNMLAMAFHGGAMPVHASTLAALGQDFAPGTALAASKDLVIQSSPLGWLADWLVFRVGPIAIIASPGDLVVLIGILYWLLVSPSQRKDRAHAPRHDSLPFRARQACPPSAE
jgi:hypothetical protein